MDYAQIEATYRRPFFDLLQQARAVHEAHWPEKDEMQLCTLLSIKTGGCSEDCGYCAQSARYTTGVKSERLLGLPEVLAAASQAKANGSTRFCMGAAWRGVRAGTEKFNQVLDIVREVSQLGMEVCVTLGQLTGTEAAQLKEAGVTAYNHNIDTSPDYYPEIVTTHTFQDRLDTIRAVQDSGMALCCGGIVGLGETTEDRLKMLAVLTSLDPAPESVPINCLMAMPGTPLEDQPPVDIFDLVRLIATTRLAPADRPGATLGGPHAPQSGRAGPVFLCRGELGFLRGQTAHGGKPRRPRRPGAAARPRPAPAHSPGRNSPDRGK